MHDRLAEDTSNCPIGLTLEIVGEKWTLLILREAFYGVQRFDDFRQILGCASNLLTARLSTLVKHGILTVEQYQEPGQRARPQYTLTPKGAALQPVLGALQMWGDRFLPDPAGPVAIVTHRECGARVSVSVQCEHGHTLTPGQAQIERGPGARRKS